MASAIAAIAGDLLHSPNLQVENPMQAYQQYQQAQAAKAEADERAQLTQEQVLKNQETQQAMQSQQALMRAYTEVYGGGNAGNGSPSLLAGSAGAPTPQPIPAGPAAAPVPQAIPAGPGSVPVPQTIPDGPPLSRTDDVIRRALQYGATPQAIQAFQTSQLAYKKSLTDSKKDDLELQDKQSTDALNIVGPLSKLPPDQLAKQWGPAMSVVLGRGDFPPGDLAKIGLDPNTPPDPQHLQFLVSVLNGHQNEIKQEQQNRELAAKEKEADTAAQKQANEAPGQVAQSDILAAKADAMKGFKQNPQGLLSQVDSIFPPDVPGNSGPNIRYRQQLQFALGRGDFDEVNKIMDAANAEAGTVAKETNPLVQQNKLATSAAEGRAHAAATIAAQQAQYAGTPLATVPPHMAQAAANHYSKVTDAHEDAVQAADDLQTFTNLARSGNKVAYAYSPVEGVLSLNTGRGVKRVNMPEIESYGGAGSALDRIKGFLGKQVSGASIPPDVLDDMDTLHQAVRQNADKAYASKVAAGNATFGSTYKPMVHPQDTSSPSTVPPEVKTLLSRPGVAPGVHKLSDGTSWMKGTDGSISKQ
jgi:hypothetical protein